MNIRRFAAVAEKIKQTYGNHYRALIRLGVPIVIGQMGMIVLSFADTLMIGHHSTQELAAASFVNSLMNLFIIFGTGFSYGLTPVVGEFFGQQRQREAGMALRCSLVANLLMALLIIFVLAILYACIDFLRQPAELLPFIRPYFLVLALSLLPVMLFNAFKQFTDGITDTRTSMWILLGGNLLNIIGNYLLVYGKWGMPELGLFGAGVSTLCSRILMVAAYVWLLFAATRFRPYLNGFLKTAFSFPVFRRLHTVGWPVALQMGMETASFSLTAIMVGWLGTLSLAAHQVMLTISQFTFMMYYGLGAAIAIRVSNYQGKADRKNIRRTVSAGFHLMICMELLLTGILALFHRQMGGWFTDTAEVVQLVSSLFVPFVVYQFGDGLQITFSNALRGISEVKVVMLYAFVAYFIVSLPVCYVFAFLFKWNLPGIWMSFPFGLTTAGVLFWHKFYQKMRKTS